MSGFLVFSAVVLVLLGSWLMLRPRVSSQNELERAKYLLRFFPQDEKLSVLQLAEKMKEVTGGRKSPSDAVLHGQVALLVRHQLLRQEGGKYFLPPSQENQVAE